MQQAGLFNYIVKQVSGSIDGYVLILIFNPWRKIQAG